MAPGCRPTEEKPEAPEALILGDGQAENQVSRLLVFHSFTRFLRT